MEWKLTKAFELTEAFDRIEDKVTACHLREEVVCVPDGVRVIGAGAFKGCTSIKQVLLPASLERIEAHAFKGCRQLEAVSFPENLQFIGSYAFHRCHHLKEIRLPKGITELSDCAFLYCDGLEFASLPGVRKMGKQAFVNATSLKKLVISPDLSPECISDSFTGCTRIAEISIANGGTYSTENLIAVMEAKEENPEIIRAIAADIYHMMDMEHGVLTEFHVEPKEVVIPEGIRAIGKSCFYNKRGILTIHLPLSLEVIGERAFRNCMNLEHLSLQNTDTKISKDAFKNCTTLKRITLNGITYSLTGLPSQAKNRQVPELVHRIHTQLLENFCISGTVLLRYWGNEARVTVPDGITIIGERAFAGNEAVGKLILPESVVEIQKEAFADCVVLQTLNFPKGLKRIGRSAFEGCVKLLRAEIPVGVASLSPSIFSRCRKLGQVIWQKEKEQYEIFEKNSDNIEYEKEGKKKSLEHVEYEKEGEKENSNYAKYEKEGEKRILREIGQQAFYGCYELKEFLFPESLEQIGTLAFYQCHALRNVTLPKAVWRVGAEAFACCKGLREVRIEGTITDWGRNIFAYAEKLKKIIFCGNQEIIPDYIAWKCIKLKQVVVSDAVKMVGLAALEGTAFLKECSLPKVLGTIFLDGRDRIGEVVIPEGITAIAGGAFYGNDRITSVQLPDSLELLGERAFCNCVHLQEIRLPKRVTVISNGAFAYCTGLERIFAEGKIQEVGEKACYQCFALQEIPDLYQAKIGDYAFYGCREWKRGIVEDSQIGAYAFGETGLLKAQIEKYFLWQEMETKRLAYPTAAVGDMVAEGKNNGNQATSHPTAAIGEILYYSAVIGGTVVDGSLASGEVIFLAESCKIGAIAPYAYYGNQQITRVILPVGLKEIGSFAFCGCTRLCEVFVPDSVERIGESAFEKCSQLLTFSSSAAIVGKRAFAFCDRLRFVLLPQIKELQMETFFHCSCLETLEIPKITQIGAGSFKGCHKLQDLSVLGVKVIEEEAFAGCESLTRMAFSDGVWIAAKSFLDCCGLKALAFAGERTEFDSSAFWGTSFLEEVQIAEQVYPILGYHDLFREELPEFVRKIYASAISCFSFQETGMIVEYRTNARALRIPQGIEAIAGEVFKDCIRLEQVEIPESVTYIGERAFWGTEWLRRKKEENPLVICNRILLDGTAANGHVIIPEEVLMISGWAFANCYGLLELTFLNRKVVIEPHTFRNCIYLKCVTAADGTIYRMSGISVLKDRHLPEWIRQIFEDALNCYKTDALGTLTECTGNITNFALVQGITAIGNGVFCESNLLTHARFTEDVEWIGESAFARCKWLASIEGAVGVKEIGAMAFSGCIRLERVEFSNHLVKIGKRAFENCTSLQEIFLPEGLTEIPERAFFRCRSLRKVVIPKGVRVIGEEAFAFCDSLQEIVLPKGLQRIGKRGFAWCTKITGRNVPLRTEVAEDAFAFYGGYGEV